MVRQITEMLTCSNCLMTNWPKIPHSINFLRLKLSLTSTLTANRPKTAPDAPREIVAFGCNKYDAILAPVVPALQSYGVGREASYMHTHLWLMQTDACSARHTPTRLPN